MLVRDVVSARLHPVGSCVATVCVGAVLIKALRNSIFHENYCNTVEFRIVAAERINTRLVITHGRESDLQCIREGARAFDVGASRCGWFGGLLNVGG